MNSSLFSNWKTLPEKSSVSEFAIMTNVFKCSLHLLRKITLSEGLSLVIELYLSNVTFGFFLHFSKFHTMKMELLDSPVTWVLQRSLFQIGNDTCFIAKPVRSLLENYARKQWNHVLVIGGKVCCLRNYKLLTGISKLSYLDSLSVAWKLF